MPFYESERPSRWALGIGGWIIVVIIFFGAISIALWAFGVWSAPWKGAGDAYKTKESGTNRIAAQERFEDLYADIVATDRKLDAAAAKVKAAPDSVVAMTEYNGLVNYCLDVVGDYDAEARKYTAEQWRSTDLPSKIDITNPETDCKESAA